MSASRVRVLTAPWMVRCVTAQPAKSWELYNKWTDRISQEFLAQGDAEREAGLPVTPIFDRTHPIPRAKLQVGYCGARCQAATTHTTRPGAALHQVGFINAIVKPLYTAFARVPGVDISVCTSQLQHNLDRWTAEIDREATVGGGQAPHEAAVEPPPSDDADSSAGSAGSHHQAGAGAGAGAGDSSGPVMVAGEEA